MNQWRNRAAAFLTVMAICLSTASSRGENENEENEAKKREALWQALQKALPKEFQRIDVYAENPSLTAVIFRSKGATLKFSTKTGKVEEVIHMRELGQINRITFQSDKKSGGAWLLWLNGRRELTIAADE